MKFNSHNQFELSNSIIVIPQRHSERLRVFALTSSTKDSLPPSLVQLLSSSTPTSRRTIMDIHDGKASATEQVNPITDDTKELHLGSSSNSHVTPEVIGVGYGAGSESAGLNADEIQASKGGWFAYLKTRNFYLVLILGYGNFIHLSYPHGVSTRSADWYNKDKSSPSASQLQTPSLHYSLRNRFPSLHSKHCGTTSFSRSYMARIQSIDTALRDGSSLC